jgi:hypothetical protein
MHYFYAQWETCFELEATFYASCMVPPVNTACDSDPWKVFMKY